MPTRRTRLPAQTPSTPAPVPAPPHVRPDVAAAPPAPTQRTRCPISIADRVARAFPPLACVRGFRTFSLKRVDLVVVKADEVDADIKGKRTQHVCLRVDQGRLAAGCTCVATTLGPAACRHVWATLLEVDRRGVLEGLRATQRVLALQSLETKELPRRVPKASARP